MQMQMARLLEGSRRGWCGVGDLSLLPSAVVEWRRGKGRGRGRGVLMVVVVE